MMHGFHVYPLPAKDALFEELAASAQLEDVGKGRRGGVLTLVDQAGVIPLVRTTTSYRAPAQPFDAAHTKLARQLQERAALLTAFNNALIETYTREYTTMGAHSDQALDLEEGSAIAVFSCYQRPDLPGSFRTLLVQEKAPGERATAVPLLHNHVVVFSVDTNRRFKHKIVLSPAASPVDNPWLAITFRTSRTFLRFSDEHARFLDGSRLTLADDEERREFLQLRRRENQEPNFTYPRIPYTLSESDLLPPAGSR